MVVIKSKILRSPLFVWGLVARLLLILFVQPFYSEQSYFTFIREVVSPLTMESWDTFISLDGANVFSYRHPMALIFIPLTSLGMGIDELSGASGVFSAIGFKLTLLIFEAIGLWIALHIIPNRDKLVIAVYWISPLSLFVTYWYGRTEIVPVVMMLAAFAALRNNEIRVTGALLGVGVAAKLIMIFIVPFFTIHMWRSRRLRADLPKFAVAIVTVALTILVPFALFSPSFQSSLFGTSPSVAMLGLVLPISNQIELYILLFMYLLLLYAMWWIRNNNFEMLFTLTGITSIVLVLASSAGSEWYLWTLPFLTFYAARTTRIGVVLVYVFMLLVVTMFFSLSTEASISLENLVQTAGDVTTVVSSSTSLFMTLIAAIGLILAMRMFVEGVQFNPYYRASRRPLVLGIAGDSGSGKDTLAAVLRDLFGRHSVTMIFGDAYHKWERGAPMWRAMTHLNPKANDLSAMTRDSIAVITGETVYRRHYNHQVGRFMRPSPIKPNDIIIVAGLHALFQPQLREKLDVKIFLDTDDTLRQFWKLRRDTTTRNHDFNKVRTWIADRRADAEFHIAPQAQHADLVFNLLPVNVNHILPDSQSENIPLKLRVRIRDALYYEALIRVLIGVCGLQIDWDVSDDGRTFDFTVEGDVTAADIHLAVNSLVPQLNELLYTEQAWGNNMTGVMQLVTLAHIEQTLRKRILE
jgi:uridine kinase